MAKGSIGAEGARIAHWRKGDTGAASLDGSRSEGCCRHKGGWSQGRHWREGTPDSWPRRHQRSEGSVGDKGRQVREAGAKRGQRGRQGAPLVEEKLYSTPQCILCNYSCSCNICY